MCACAFVREIVACERCDAISRAIKSCNSVSSGFTPYRAVLRMRMGVANCLLHTVWSDHLYVRPCMAGSQVNSVP